MNDTRKQLLNFQNKAGTIKVQNILSPLLWLTAVCVPTGTMGLIFSNSDQGQFLFQALVGAPILSVLVAYAYFAFRDPNRLQSEEYLIRSEQLQIISKQGGKITSPEELELVDLDSNLLGNGGSEHE